MNRKFSAAAGFFVGTVALLCCSTPVLAASATAAQVLQVAPSQEGVDYDRPKPEDVPRCKVSAKKIGDHVGWVVESPEGILLRKFLDTNGDNVVDQWSFYKDGVEVYRDIATKPGGKKDEFRWLNTAGTRWGVDMVGNGKLTTWKAISAEEVTAEIIAAVANRDNDRFVRVLLAPEELQSLGLGKAKSEAVAGKVAKAGIDFRTLADRQKTVTPESKWVQFSGSRPGVVPAGSDDSTRDIEVYENVVAIVQTGDKHTQVQIGTLIRVGNTWKTIDPPVISGEGPPEVAAMGFFFQAAQSARSGAATVGPGEESQKIIAEMEGMEPGDPRRVEIFQKLIDHAKTSEERILWSRQLADTLSAGVQSGKLSDGEKRLQALWESAQRDTDKNLAAYIRFRLMTAGYVQAISAPKADVAKIQADWPKKLEQFISEYPTSPDAVEAMLQLGIAREYAGQDDDAKKWYERIGREFTDLPQAKKAAGAARRIDSVGTLLNLSGKSLGGETVDLASYRGKVVLIQYWATWSDSVKNDMPALKQLVTKYRGSFAVIGVSVDTNAKALNAYLTDNPLPWPQIHEEGGQDSRPANALGIITVPTMILVDAQGKVVNRSIQTAEIEAELKKLIP
ncbi:MAG: redoxin domain-containing protein [Planctomycetota bacterium]